jgi:hypothetical protein
MRVGSGNTAAGVHHAEALALQQAGEAARGATAYTCWSPTLHRLHASLRESADRRRCWSSRDVDGRPEFVG